MNFRYIFHLLCVFNCAVLKWKFPWPWAYASNPGNYIEVTGATIVTPVNQKSRQQSWLSSCNTHSNLHIWHAQLAPFYKGILVKNFFALCHLRPDSPEKALCSQVPRSTLSPAFLCRKSVLHPSCMTVLPLRNVSLSKAKARTNLTETTGVFPTVLIKTLISPM